MPRAPAQKFNHPSTTVVHPYSIASDVNTSASIPNSGTLSPRSQKQYQGESHPQPHMDSLPPPSTLYPQNQQSQQQQYQGEDANSSVKQASPHDTPNLQAQSNSGRPEASQGNHQHRSSQDGPTKSANNGVSSSLEPSRAQPNGNASPSVPNSASMSGPSSAPAKVQGQASGANGGPGLKKKHVCPTCDRAFTTSGHLARHARVHTGERNHKCPFPGCETRCSRQDNLQQHYRIHLSPGSRRSSSSATRAAIRGAIANPTASPSTIGPATAADLDAPPPLAQATFPPPHLVHYAPVHQTYSVPPQASVLPQSHAPSPHIVQQPYHPHTPPIPNGTGHTYGNDNSNGLPADVSRGYGHGQPESPSAHSGPGSATPSADASPVIGGPGTSSQSYAGQQQTYIYVQHPGYYQSSQHPSPSPQAPGPSTAAYTTPPPPSTSVDSQYQAQQPQMSTFYQQHHYPREAYINSSASTSPAAQPIQTPPNYTTQQPLSQQAHHQGYTEPPKAKTKRRGRTGGGSIGNNGQSPNDTPVITNMQGHPSSRTNGQGQSNVYAFYGMSAPSSTNHATAPPPIPAGGTIAGAPPPSSASSHGSTRYTVTGNGSGFGQFQLHTPPPPPPLTPSSTATASSGVSYSSGHGSYPQGMDASNAVSGNGTHSPPPVLAPIQTKRPSYHEALPSRYSYAQHAVNASYAPVGRGYAE